jgi:hypothetical protein
MMLKAFRLCWLLNLRREKTMNNRRLFAWQPNGHGEKSFFVVAETEEQARAAVEAKISDLLAKSKDGDYFGEDGIYSEIDFSGWGTDYYKLTVADIGEVVMNSND